MISISSSIEGKKCYFGDIREGLKKYRFFLCGAWEYDRGKFDAILWREKGETIYLRIPFHVLQGELDRSEAYIQFRTPYIIKHVVNLGLDRDENSLLSATGFNQFQKPLDKDGQIDYKQHWQEYGQGILQNILHEYF